MLAGSQLDAALATAPLFMFDGVAYRSVLGAFAKTPLSGRGALNSVGRYHVKGVCEVAHILRKK